MNDCQALKIIPKKRKVSQVGLVISFASALFTILQCCWDSAILSSPQWLTKRCWIQCNKKRNLQPDGEVFSLTHWWHVSTTVIYSRRIGVVLGWVKLNIQYCCLKKKKLTRMSWCLALVVCVYVCICTSTNKSDSPFSAWQFAYSCAQNVLSRCLALLLLLEH